MGDVRFEIKNYDSYTCTLCERVFKTYELARHARKKHAPVAKGVLPGQLGLPGTGTPDVPPSIQLPPAPKVAVGQQTK